MNLVVADVGSLIALAKLGIRVVDALCTTLFGAYYQYAPFFGAY